MGQLYASREILFNCKIFSLQRQWSSLWEEGVSGGELSYQVECQDNKMEVERNYSWNIFLLPYYYNSVSSSLARLTPVYTSVCQEWSGGQSPFVWCSVILVAGSLSL